MKKWLIALATLLLAGAGARAEDALWTQLRAGGNVLLIRHAATEPGVGDPPGFRLDDCATQRNLSEAGREQAMRLGRLLKFRAIPVTEVRTSPWCRCQETARLAFGPAEPWDVLGSIAQHPERKARLVKEVTAAAAQLHPRENLALLTHHLNVEALAGIDPAPAEIVVVKNEGGKLKVLGRLPPAGN